MPSILSTGIKKAKARSVFGGDVFADAETSLCYSPSPGPKKTEKLNDNEDRVENGPKPMVLFAEKNTIVEDDILDEKENVAENTSSTSGTKESFQAFRNAELNRLRAAQSPLRKSLAEQTQAAVTNATSSVAKTLSTPASTNQSLNASRKAKKAVLRERNNESKSVRFQWDEENAQGKEFYEKVEESRRQLLTIQRKLASAHFKDKARKDQAEKLRQIAEWDKNLHFNSEVYRDHQKRLKEERENNRKKSMDARRRLRQNKREGEEKLENMRRENEAANFEIRYDLHRARTEAAKAKAEERRKSFQFRAGDAKRIRNARAQWKHEDCKAKEESYQLDRHAANDVRNHKKKSQADQREDTKSRNMNARRQRHEERNRMIAAMNEEHKSYELKWAGEKDAEKYRKEMLEERRKSLAGRNKESARHAKVMQELRALSMEQETESFMLKFAAQDDAKAYLAKLAEERRQSLELRGKEAQRRRLYEDEQHRISVANNVKDGLLQSESQKDVEAYKKAMADRSRKSLQFRGKESMVRRLEEKSKRTKEQEVDHKNFELDSLARMDVEEYLMDCKKRRRKSLAFRAKEKKRHAVWKRQQKEKELEAQQETTHLKSVDYRFMALAQQEERSRIAMDALRRAGCTITGNPFADLMKL